MPGVTGQSLDDAKAKLEGDGYRFQVKTKPQISTEDPNTVLDQDPKLGAEVQKGSTITLTIAKVQEKSTVPDVTGKSCDEAKALMTANNLAYNCTQVDTADDAQVDKVVSTSPQVGSSVDKNSTVTIQIGKKAQTPQKNIPDVRGRTLQEARQILQQNGFNNIQVNGDQNDNARVIAQDPQQGQADPNATTINLTTIGGNGNNGGNGGGFIGGN